MLFSNMATANDTFEIISMKFKDSVSVQKQKELLNQLNSIVKKFDGFKARDYYYSEDNGRWIDYVVWESLKHAKKASEEVMRNPEAGEIFQYIDDNSMIFSHYNRIGGAKKD